MTYRYTLRHDISRAIGDLVALSTSTNTSGTTLVDTVELLWANDDALNGCEVFIYADTTAPTAVGQARWITDFTASSDTITVPTWTVTPTAAAASYEIHRRFRVSEYNAAIDAAYDAVRTKHMLTKVDESIILNSIIPNSLIATWTSSSALTGWTTTGTGAALARESTIIYSKYYSAKLTNQASQKAQIDASADARYAGRTITIKGNVFCQTASRVRLYIYSSAGGAPSTSQATSYHDGNSWCSNDSMSLTYTTGSNWSGVYVGMLIDTGTSISAYLGRIEAYCGSKDDLPSNIHEYNIPTGFISISEVGMEGAEHNVFYPLRSDYDWKIIGDTTKRLWIRNPLDGRAIRIIGQAKHTKLTADTDTVTLNEEFVKNYAAWYLLRSKPQTGDYNKMAMFETEWRRLMRQLTVSPQGKQVEMVG